MAIANPLGDICDVGAAFPSLCSLTLNSTKLSKWKSVEALTALPDLRELSLLSVPLGQAMKEKERRFAVIARMPALSKLNKSEISETERENAERWAIRHYQGKRQQPSTYQQLVETHGHLEPLAKVNLTPHHQACILFHIEHPDWQRTESHTVDLHQTTTQLKHWLSRKLDILQSKFRLFYEDAEVMGLECTNEELRGRTRQLLAFNMKDGDHIHVQIL